MKNKSGKITRQEDGFKVVFERTLDHNIQKVWDAITNPEKLKFWFTDIVMDFRKGGKLTIFNRDEDGSSTNGKILKIEQPTRFEYMWEDDLAVWELFPLAENKCKLTLTYGKVHQDIAANTTSGWHVLLDRLEMALGGSRKKYPFGTEENDPEILELEEFYAGQISGFIELIAGTVKPSKK